MNGRNQDGKSDFSETVFFFGFCFLFPKLAVDEIYETECERMMFCTPAAGNDQELPPKMDLLSWRVPSGLAIIGA